MADADSGDGPQATTLRNLVNRLAAIKLRAYVLRRRVRRPEPLDPAAVEEQLAGIERDVEDATHLVRDELGSV